MKQVTKIINPNNYFGCSTCFGRRGISIALEWFIYDKTRNTVYRRIRPQFSDMFCMFYYNDSPTHL